VAFEKAFSEALRDHVSRCAVQVRTSTRNLSTIHLVKQFVLHQLSKDGKVDAGSNCSAAKEIGTRIAAKAKEAGVSDIVFDRNGYRFHGRVKSLAEGAREGGLKF
jgi:ribosomal protein L18